jgi:hypothetical protein
MYLVNIGMICAKKQDPILCFKTANAKGDVYNSAKTLQIDNLHPKTKKGKA